MNEYDNTEKILKDYISISPRARTKIATEITRKLHCERAPKQNKKHLYAIAASIVALIGVLVLVFAEKVPGNAGVVTEVWNECIVIRHGERFTNIQPGFVLQINDTIKTGSQSGVHIQTTDGSRISVAENSSLEYSAMRGEKLPTIFLHTGNMLASVTPNPEKLFLVKTPATDLKVLGTEFEVKINHQMALATTLTVLSGAVAVHPANAVETTIKSGNIAEVSTDGAMVVSELKAGEFFASMVKANYRQNNHIWIANPLHNLVVSPIYQFNPATGENKKVIDLIGTPSTSGLVMDHGAIFNIWSVLLSGFDTVGNNSGTPLVNAQLLAMAADGKVLALDCISSFSPLYPALSPDGAQIAFIGTELKDGDRIVAALYVVDLKTLEVRALLEGAFRTVPAWSHDSSTIFISAGQGYTATHQILAINVTSGEVKNTNLSGCGVAVSPDGKYIAYSGNFKRDGAWSRGVPFYGDLFVTEYPNGKTMAFKGDGEGSAFLPVFSGNGNQVSYVWIGPEGTSIRVVDLNTSQSREVGAVKGDVTFQRWIDANTLVVASADYVAHKTFISRIDLSAEPAVMEDITPDFVNDPQLLAAQNAVTEVLSIHLAGQRDSYNNRLAETLKKYQEAYKKLLALQQNIVNVDSSFYPESLHPYVEKFKAGAALTEEELYNQILINRLNRLPFCIDSYVWTQKQLPMDIDALMEYISSHDDNVLIGRNNMEARNVFLMPDQEPESKSAFRMEVINDNTIVFRTDPTPYGERYQITAVRDHGRWRPAGTAERIP